MDNHRAGLRKIRSNTFFIRREGLIIGCSNYILPCFGDSIKQLTDSALTSSAGAGRATTSTTSIRATAKLTRQDASTARVVPNGLEQGTGVKLMISGIAEKARAGTTTDLVNSSNHKFVDTGIVARRGTSGTGRSGDPILKSMTVSKLGECRKKAIRTIIIWKRRTNRKLTS
jgi:hypothetical protein